MTAVGCEHEVEVRGKAAYPKGAGGATTEMTAISFKIPDLDDQDMDHSPLHSHPDYAQVGAVRGGGCLGVVPS